MTYPAPFGDALKSHDAAVKQLRKLLKNKGIKARVLKKTPQKNWFLVYVVSPSFETKFTVAEHHWIAAFAKMNGLTAARKMEINERVFLDGGLSLDSLVRNEWTFEYHEPVN